MIIDVKITYVNILFFKFSLKVQFNDEVYRLIESNKVDKYLVRKLYNICYCNSSLRIPEKTENLGNLIVQEFLFFY